MRNEQRTKGEIKVPVKKKDVKTKEKIRTPDLKYREDLCTPWKSKSFILRTLRVEPIQKKLNQSYHYDRNMLGSLPLRT